MDQTLRAKVEVLLEKASTASDADQAVRFSQAAFNAANTLRVLDEMDSREPAPAPK